VDVSLEDNSLEDVVPDVPGVPDDDVNLEDLVLDVPDDVADEDDDTDDDHQEIEVNEAVYDDMEEMNESSLLKLLEEYDYEKNHNGCIPFEFEAAIELLSMLRKSNVSFGLYGKIISWAEQFVPGLKSEKFPTREAVIKMLSQRYHLDCLKPYRIPCVMPMTNLEFDVITHNFIASIFSLLTDEELMRPENLIFDDWQKPAAAFTKHPEGIFEEINSGSAYKQFKNNMQDPDNTIILPIIIFGDGTVIDGAQ